MTIFELGQRERAIAADTIRRFLKHSNERLRQPFVLMLAGNLPKPVVQLLPPAVERCPVMVAS
jgi:hypothetical protein